MKLLLQLRNSTRSKFLIVLFMATLAAGQDLIDNTLQTGENLFSTVPLSVFAAGAAGSFLTFRIEDRAGYRTFLPEQPFKTLDAVDNFVFGKALLVAAPAFWLTGNLTDSDQVESVGEELCRGLAYTYGIVQTLKLTTGRIRPDESDNMSFPSAHAAGASCTATVLWNRYGTDIGIPLSILTLYTCLSRVNLEKHFPSDVILGAAIGVACGIASTTATKGEEVTAFSFSLSVDTEGRITPGLW